MYKMQEIPDVQAVMDNGAIIYPLITLIDEYGGMSHIIKDDGCYVLVNRKDNGKFSKTYWWYPEAVDALKLLRK